MNVFEKKVNEFERKIREMGEEFGSVMFIDESQEYRSVDEMAQLWEKELVDKCIWKIIFSFSKIENSVLIVKISYRWLYGDCQSFIEYSTKSGHENRFLFNVESQEELFRKMLNGIDGLNEGNDDLYFVVIN